MFYQFDDEATSVNISELNDNALTAAYLNVKELEKFFKILGLPIQSVEMCKEEIGAFSNNIEIFDKCLFVKINLVGFEKKNCIGIYILKNFFAVISILDNGCDNRNAFMKMMSRVCSETVNLERMICSFFEILIHQDNKTLEKIQGKITTLEEAVMTDKTDESFNFKLLNLKKEILSYRGHYEQLLDIVQSLIENEIGIFDDEQKCFNTLRDKIDRLKDNVELLMDSVIHLWDAYQTSIDMKLNQTMKIFTLVTTIFFPLTVIVGWYGMNFKFMPEISWKYGYIYVIMLSAVVIFALIYWFKRKRWL